MTIEFGAHIEPQLGFDYVNIEKIAIEAEKFGYDSFWCSDHLFLDDESEEKNCMEAWTLLAALAAKTNKIRLGTMVTCNSYRHPPLLAKIAATIDMISNGRLIFGYGAGWKKIEYEAYGYPFPSLKERMDRMEEAIQIIRLLWTEPKPSFTGKYYSIKDAFSAPKPIQKPYPPILIGGDGEKRTLKAVAKYADFCNLFPKTVLEHKLNVLKEHCKDIGRDYSAVRKSLFTAWPSVFIAESEDELEAHFAYRAEQRKMSIAEVKEFLSKDFPGSWVGYAEDIRDRFQHFIDLGFDYFMVSFPGLGDDYIKSSQIFAKKIIAKL